MHHLMGIAEIGERLGVTTARAFRIAADYEDFPEPVAELKAGRVWSSRSVEAWIRKHPNRKVGRPAKKSSSKAKSK